MCDGLFLTILEKQKILLLNSENEPVGGIRHRDWNEHQSGAGVEPSGGLEFPGPRLGILRWIALGGRPAGPESN
jgi:hypothetical protein